jgi:exopolysaccharide production protein ExoZ
VIYSAHQADIFSPRQFVPFVFKRAIRIYPIYWLVFLSVFAVGSAVPSFQDQIPQDWTVVVKSLALFPQNQAEVGGTGAPVIEVAWTLQVEMVFYFFFGILILGKVISLLIYGSLVLIYFCRESLSDPFLISFLFQKHALFLFLVGMGSAWVCSKKPLSVRNGSSLAILGGIIFVLISLDWILGMNEFDGEKLYIEELLLR